MAKHGSTTRSAATGQFLSIRAHGAPRAPMIKFGSVMISGAEPAATLVKVNVERSTKALERIAKRLTKPGVPIRAKKNVPQYSVADDETGVFIRRLNGRTERGRLIKGAFRVID
jgi:hypothetical protein